RDLVLRRVLGGDDADALGRTRRRAERAADALLEPGVLEPLQLVLAAEARVDGRLLLGVLDRHGTLTQAAERGGQPAQRLAEGPVGTGEPARLGAALDLDHVLARVPGAHEATTIAVT